MRMTTVLRLLLSLVVAAVSAAGRAEGGDLEAVRQRGVLRHLGVRYANFVTGGGEGLDVELMQLFAKRLGVRYEFVETDWPAAIPDLVGRQVSAATDLAAAPPAPIRGDVLATGLTILPWRQRVVAFSTPVFPTQVWVVARAESALRPIRGSDDLAADVAEVKRLLPGRSLMGVQATCLDPALYRLEETGARLVIRKLRLDEMAPALVNGDAELALLDVADAMIALQRWPGHIKVLGPVSPVQEMGVAFRQGSPQLLSAFEGFLAGVRTDGTYDRLVRKYFPEAPSFFPAFFGQGR